MITYILIDARLIEFTLRATIYLGTGGVREMYDKSLDLRPGSIESVGEAYNIPVYMFHNLSVELDELSLIFYPAVDRALELASGNSCVVTAEFEDLRGFSRN